MSVAPTNSRDDQLLVRYLIGALSVEEAERIDELSVADNRFASDLRVVEDDLLDAYARGALAADTLHGFETHYLAQPGAAARVAFARALRSYQESARGYGAARVSRAGWASGGMRWGALAAAAVLLLATSVYFITENVRMRHQIADLRASVEAGQRQLEQQVQREQAAADRARESERARQSLAQAQTPPQGQLPRRAVIASLVLMPPVRGSGVQQTLSTPRGTGDVAVRLALDADEFPAYRVALRDVVAGQTVWRSGSLRAVVEDGVKALSFTVGAELLKPRTYVFEVIGVRARETPEAVASYPFEVVAQ